MPLVRYVTERERDEAIAAAIERCAQIADAVAVGAAVGAQIEPLAGPALVRQAEFIAAAIRAQPKESGK